MHSELDVLDPLMNVVEPKRADPFGVPELSPEQRARVLEGKAKDLAASGHVPLDMDKLMTAADALEDAVVSYANKRTDAGRDNVLILLKRVEDSGLKVDRPRLVELGILPPDAPLDLDAPPDVPDEPEPVPSAPAESVDPLSMAPEDGMVPVYNPTAFVADLRYNGRRYPISMERVGWANVNAANEAVGPDNLGGRLSHFGVRRLYGLESRFLEHAKKSSLTLVEWVKRRNDALMFTADGIWAKHVKENPMPEIELPEN